MGRLGARYRLLLYTYMLNRWWRATLMIGITLLALVAGLVWLPRFLPQFTFLDVQTWILWLNAGTGAFAIFLSIFLASVRKSAYVQPFSDHMRLVTPFLRMDISYRRFVRASTAEMGRLFFISTLRGRKRDFLQPISRNKAIVLEMNGWPLPRWTL